MLIASPLGGTATTITIGDRDVTDLVEHRRAPLVGRVFQNPLDGTAAGMTVEENLALAARRGHGRGLRQAIGSRERQLFREHLTQIGLGLERYDGIGRYRETYGNGDAIDPSGVMPDGTPFAGPDQPPIPGATFTWVARDPAVVSVDAAGLVTALANGSTYVVATLSTDPLQRD